VLQQEKLRAVGRSRAYLHWRARAKRTAPLQLWVRDAVTWAAEKEAQVLACAEARAQAEAEARFLRAEAAAEQENSLRRQAAAAAGAAAAAASAAAVWAADKALLPAARVLGAVERARAKLAIFWQEEQVGEMREREIRERSERDQRERSSQRTLTAARAAAGRRQGEGSFAGVRCGTGWKRQGQDGHGRRALVPLLPLLPLRGRAPPFPRLR
jgi:fused signal recognition particle receptor